MNSMNRASWHLYLLWYALKSSTLVERLHLIYKVYITTYVNEALHIICHKAELTFV
jgi:hypothetical protein